jgi:hypothetical protein
MRVPLSACNGTFAPQRAGPACDYGGLQPVLPAVKSEGLPRKDHSEPSSTTNDTHFQAQGSVTLCFHPIYLESIAHALR